VSLQSNVVVSSFTATLVQIGTPTACLATQEPWVIDSGATDHMTGTSGCFPILSILLIFPVFRWHMAQPLMFLIWALLTLVQLSLSFVLYILKYPFSLMYVSKLIKGLNRAAIFLSTH
jgi:hypothetical protein